MIIVFGCKIKRTYNWLTMLNIYKLDININN